MVGIDWQSYKALCDRPDVLSRWMLEETATLLPGETRTALMTILSSAPFPKPDDHKGGEATDMFNVDLPPDVLRSIVEVVLDAAERGLRTPRSSKIAGFATAWRELQDAQAASRV
ncbi:MAG: hypothetical protein F4029_20395 [Gammaproteobacteria bacterium]|nr:hypothetical protein [Gammaproteobacteria bacterium]MXY55086.1 hypothetical protein [Gammaproteobacteria bacterium]MYF27878.1 hypothetical protein [Gammaproteobacteria bacterium]MYK48575.1 hypothetical protein [Gammaproteobacteria bacterium]